MLLSKIVPHIRRTWIVSEGNGHRLIGSGEWIVFRHELIHPPYLRQLLKSDEFHAKFMSTVAGVGGSLLRARPTSVARIAVPMPQLEEQRRIAAILDQAEALRSKRRQALAKLDTLTKSLFLELFGDPVTNVFQWPEISVGQLCTLVRGSSPRPQGDSRYYGGSVPRLMVADVTRDGWLVTPRIDSLTEQGAKFSRPVPAGTVVMAVSGNVGVVSQLAIPACIHDGFVGFTNLCETRIHAFFLVVLLDLLKSTHGQRKAGAIFQNLTTTDIKAMRLPIPPVSMQIAFCGRAVSVGMKAALVKQSTAMIDNLFSELQHRAFHGEL